MQRKLVLGRTLNMYLLGSCDNSGLMVSDCILCLLECDGMETLMFFICILPQSRHLQLIC